MKPHQFPKNRFSKHPTKLYPFPKNATGPEITGTMKGNVNRLLHGFRRTSTPFASPADLAAWVFEVSLKQAPWLASDEKSLSETWKRALVAAEYALDNYDPEHRSIVGGAKGGRTSRKTSPLLAKLRELEGLSVAQQAVSLDCSERHVKRLRAKLAEDARAGVTVEDSAACEVEAVPEGPDESPWDLEDEKLFHETKYANLFTDTSLDLPIQTWADTYDREAEDLKAAYEHVDHFMDGIVLDAPEESSEARELAPVYWLDDFRKPAPSGPELDIDALFDAAILIDERVTNSG